MGMARGTSARVSVPRSQGNRYYVNSKTRLMFSKASALRVAFRHGHVLLPTAFWATVSVFWALELLSVFLKAVS